MATNAPVIAPKESPPEQHRRGRIFTAVYGTVMLIATAGFLGLAIFVRRQDVITYFDAPVAVAIQSLNAPILSWVLLHVSNLGWAPLDTLCVVLIAAAMVALRLGLGAVPGPGSTLSAGAAGARIPQTVAEGAPA